MNDSIDWSVPYGVAAEAAVVLLAVGAAVVLACLVVLGGAHRIARARIHARPGDHPRTRLCDLSLSAGLFLSAATAALTAAALIGYASPPYPEVPPVPVVAALGAASAVLVTAGGVPYAKKRRELYAEHAERYLAAAAAQDEARGPRRTSFRTRPRSGFGLNPELAPEGRP